MNQSSPSPAAGQAADTESKVCFLVEDNPIIQLNLTAMLDEVTNFKVAGCVQTESEAVDWILLNGGTCDLVIVDIFLASGLGTEVLRRAKHAHARPKFVVLTNYATDDIRRRVMALGADRIFDKSTDLDMLIEYCSAFN